MTDYTRISDDEQQNMLSSFLQMLVECEIKAQCDNDPVLKHWVEQWFQQWNRVTGDNKKPQWIS